jgi:hypothetical protein
VRRRHLLEIHEQPWCPAAVRDGATDCLRLIAVIGRQFQGALPLLRRALALGESDRILDLCSGGGGPWLALAQHLERLDGSPLPIFLTDLYPNQQALAAAQALAPDQIRIVRESVDATRVPPELTGLRTLFTAFHHFEPATAQAILQDAVDAGEPIAIFEQTRRSVFAQLFMFILAPLAFLAVPLIRPFTWSRIFWTYFIPAIPAVLLFDGIISCWRTYTTAELKEMAAALRGRPYVWEIGRTRSLLSPLGIGYLIGYPAGRATIQAGDTAVSTAPRVARTK